MVKRRFGCKRPYRIIVFVIVWSFVFYGCLLYSCWANNNIYALRAIPAGQSNSKNLPNNIAGELADKFKKTPTIEIDLEGWFGNDGYSSLKDSDYKNAIKKALLDDSVFLNETLIKAADSEDYKVSDIESIDVKLIEQEEYLKVFLCTVMFEKNKKACFVLAVGQKPLACEESAQGSWSAFQEFEDLKSLYQIDPEHTVKVFAKTSCQIQAKGRKAALPMFTMEFLKGYQPLYPCTQTSAGMLISNAVTYNRYIKDVVKILVSFYFKLNGKSLGINILRGPIMHKGKSIKITSVIGIREMGIEQFLVELTCQSNLAWADNPQKIDLERAKIIQEAFIEAVLENRTTP